MNVIGPVGEWGLLSLLKRNLDNLKKKDPEKYKDMISREKKLYKEVMNRAIEPKIVS